jgi:hypothetical protein
MRCLCGRFEGSPSSAKSARAPDFRFSRVSHRSIFMPLIIGGEHGLIAFVVIFGSGMLGLLVSKILPEHHTADATQGIVQTTMGTISILAALVLGLLVATAKGKFDTVNTQVEQVAGNLMLLDRELRNYGPDTVAGPNERSSGQARCSITQGIVLLAPSGKPARNTCRPVRRPSPRRRPRARNADRARAPACRRTAAPGT